MTFKMKKNIVPILTVLFFILIAYLLFQNLSKINWVDFKGALASLSWGILATTLILSFLNYFVLTTFDYFGFRYFKSPIMTYPRTVVSAFCSYVFNLNLGALIGGVGMRFRIYTGWGVPSGEVPRIVLFSSVTNWLGNTTLLASVFLLRTSEITRLIPLPEIAIKGYACLSLGLVLLYFVLCFRRYVLRIKGIVFPFPKPHLALAQLVLSMFQWGIITLIIYLLIRHLGGNVTFGEILFTTLVASIAGVFTHIPAGLGVLETIFLRMNLDVKDAELLAAILCYRALYYLIPLLVAVPTYISLETYQKKIRPL
jgi:uncharacterized membrane protein YbhN (UPF0104 family)